MSPDFLYGVLAGLGLALVLFVTWHEVWMYRQRVRRQRRGGFVDHGRTRVGR
jgi:hypothetical protein